MSSYFLENYISDEAIDLGSLIYDDFLAPIRLLADNRFYVAAAKLLFIAIDSVSFVEFGDAPKAFHKWLATYAHVIELGINEDELWEQRNSMLHMSSTRSRKVSSGKVRELLLYVGAEMPRDVELGQRHIGFYDLERLLLQFVNACNKWIETYDQDRGKFETFLPRYEKIASDARFVQVTSGKDS